jgi:hypothetical protein
LRLVPEALWCAVQDRRRAKRVRAGADAPPLRVGRGIRQKYFLAGFGRCSRCGGSMQAVSRPAAGGGRRFHYACGAYWNRGATVCSNGLLVALPAADQAVRDLVRGEVLRPGVVERALAGAVTTLQQETQDGSHVARLTAQLAGLDRELANLAETAARGGAVPAVLALLDDREQQRRRVLADLAQAQRVQAAPGVTPAALQACLRGVLGDWDGLLSGPDTVEARGVLEAVLTDRIRFTPDRDQHRYRLTLPVAFDRLLDAAVPALAGLSRNGGVPRPTCSLP